RCTPALDPAVRLAREPGAQLGEKARLPDARLADHEHDTPLVRRRALEGGPEEPEVALSADEACLGDRCHGAPAAALSEDRGHRDALRLAEAGRARTEVA